MFHSVRRHAEIQTIRPHRFGQITDYVTMRPHFGGRPVAQSAVVHGKAIVMLGDRHHVLRTRFLKQLGPGTGVEVFRLEHGDEIFVA